MKYSLRTKLSLSYIFVALVCIVLIGAVSKIFMEKHFSEYVINNQERKNNELILLVSQQYKPGMAWDSETIENIGMNALEQGMIIKVKDSDGNIVWDATLHNNGLCQEMIAHMAQNMSSRYFNWKGAYVEENYPIMYNSSKVGAIGIGYYGPYYYTDSDLAFITTLNQIILGVSLFSLLLSLLIGALMAKRLSNPISRVINTAQLISKGYYGDRSYERSSTKEIDLLNEATNNLASTLEKQETLRKRLTGDVAHELRTPLATLQSHIEAMIDGIWKPEIERLKSCHEEIVRISRMVGDLEKLAKYENENLILHKENFNISELIRHKVQSFETDFMNKKIEIKFSPKDEIINADQDKISQVIINLLSNALKYSSPGGVVEVSVGSSKDMVEVIVKDTGNGIPPEDLPHIFERFYRADKSRNRLTGGAGIGLTITKAIVEAHQGKIEVQSRLDEGTEFIVSLPKQIN
ncbi:MAG: two-component sensor histidine kinase [Clostridiales bacterium]|jgi:signal transduction histidine kinase|nr:two-component sensor histidine kinase [Clostridiales bacterium]